MSLHPVVVLGFYAACIAAGSVVLYLIDRTAAHDPMHIAACIRENPGLSLEKIAAKTNASHLRTAYTIRRLIRKHVVMRIAKNGVSTYSIRKIPKSSAEEILQEILGNDALHLTFAVVVEKPEITKREIIDTTGLSGIQMFWYLSRLEMFGAIVRDKKIGKWTYRAADTFIKAYAVYK
ncbi:MAG: hypothetical protein O0X49_07900 [Methanocorpusculum sp.]|nr:hypothetical protein [Methanocorpusculum sp.]